MQPILLKMKTPVIVAVYVLFFHAIVFSKNNYRDTGTVSGDTIVSAVFMMTIPYDGVMYDSNRRKYIQYEIYKTPDNRYLQVTVDYKVEDLEYVKDSIPLLIGDTVDLSINNFTYFTLTYLQDTLLPQLNTSGCDTEFENLRILLIKYPPSPEKEEITVIYMMTLTSPFYDTLQYLRQTYLFKTFDNKYIIWGRDFDSCDIDKFDNDETGEVKYGDTVDLDLVNPLFIHQYAINTFLEDYYDYGDTARYNTLRAILLKNTPNTTYWKPCIYWNVDTNYSPNYVIPLKYLVPMEQPLEGTADYDENPDLGMIKRKDYTLTLEI